MNYKIKLEVNKHPTISYLYRCTMTEFYYTGLARRHTQTLFESANKYFVLDYFYRALNNIKIGFTLESQVFAQDNPCAIFSSNLTEEFIKRFIYATK